MRIKKVEIKNFKFHHDLAFELGNQNCLLYGENGTGKSSIYWALYSLFKCYFRNDQFDFTKFKNQTSDNDLEVKVFLDETSLSIPRQTYTLPTDISIENHTSIYFVNQDLLNELTSNDTNFYSTILEYLKKYFTTLDKFDQDYLKINETINGTNTLKKNEEKNSIDTRYKTYIEDELTPLVNNILLEKLHENYSVKMNFEASILDTENLKFPNPKITLTIDQQSNLKLNFNEAKLKLTAIAIFFALIKIEEGETNTIKLLVLDDFLTSLDMANRKLIVQYILENFSEYQKIILTHNIQFYNLIIKLFRLQNEQEKWEIKKLFITKISNNEVSEIRNEQSFLDKAQERLKEGDLQSSGNFLRKEFERIVHEFEILLELGKVEDMSNILDALKEVRMYYPKPNDTLNSFVNSLERILELEVSNDIKLDKIAKKIVRIKDCKIDLNGAIPLADGAIEQQALSLSLQTTNFYNGILLNPLSHDDGEIEAYRKECEDIIVLLTKLNKRLSHLKGKKFD
ncbi:MAG: hypothetical protein LGB78_01570 [Sulfurovum sp.]|nr:hypothetical protein [Sulfurovum sp.]